MHEHTLDRLKHHHRFGTDKRTVGERRTWWVIGLTTAMMLAEIIGGTLYGSAALLADGWHMGTHAAALMVAAFAYAYSRRHADDSRYSFGTGKVGALGGFASAVGLAVVALMVAGESIVRLRSPITIHFDHAIAVAVVGLAVNVASALMLRDHHHGGHSHDTGHDHHGDHAHATGHDHHEDHSHHAEHHHDQNLRGAYLHVLADALTSVLAIIALFAGKHLGWLWMDPAMGIVGALLIAHWSVGLLRDTSRVLLDAELDAERLDGLRAAIEADSDALVSDLHVWRVGPRHFAVIISVVTHTLREPGYYKALLSEHHDLSHITVEVNVCPCDGDSQTRDPNSDGAHPRKPATGSLAIGRTHEAQRTGPSPPQTYPGAAVAAR